MKSKCFVLMPFTVKDIDKQRYNDLNHWTEVYEGLIVPAVQKAELLCSRDDKDIGSRLIVENILKKIEEADIVLCDLSSHNPNVFLELGWALRANKPYVLIKDDLTQFTFDLNQQFTFEYNHQLQPTKVKEEINDLCKVIKGTLGDSNHRYSIVRHMSIDASAIEAANTGDHQTQILLEIRQLLKNIPLPFTSQKSPNDLFPWPQLLRRATDVMSKIKDYVSIEEAMKPTFPENFRRKARELDIDRKLELQITILNDNHKYVYHDMESMIGNRAILFDADGHDIYDDIFSYSHGAVAWIDRFTNIPRPDHDLLYRLNIALFSKLKDSKWRIVVETHHEINN
jgi:hypothetical protein